MKNKYKIILIIGVIIGICSILVGSIAYYRIVVSGSIEGSTGNAVFVLRDTEAGESWNDKVISLGQINPGDSGSFDVVMDASGSTVDMYATLSIDRGTGDTELPTNLKFYTTSDHKSELHKYYSFLEKSGTNKETLTIYWYWNPFISDEEDNKYINKSFNASINVNAVQISEYAMMKNGYDSTTGGTEFWSNTYKPYIRTITFENDLSNLPSSCTGDSDLCWDVSYSTSQKKKVYAYLVDSGLKDSTDTTKSLYNLYIVSEAPIFAPINCNRIFSFFKYENNKYKSNLVQINFNNNFNTSKATSMSLMFDRSSSLVSLDLSNFDTSKVTDMSAMFQMPFGQVSNLKNLDINNFNTSKVTNMKLMFSQCDKIFELDVSGFNTSNVTNMCAMFQTCLSLKYLNLSSFNTSKVTDMSFMFRNIICDIDISGFNTSNVTNMSDMFFNCGLESLDLSSFNTSKVTDMNGMFYNCSKLKKLDIDNFNMKNVTLFSDSYTDGIFENCAKLTTTINITNANVTNYTDMFSGASTESGAKIVVNYTSETESLVDQMIATKSANSNVVKGSLIS